MKRKIDGLLEMETFAKQVGALAEAGDVIILSGDLGAGKTTMTKGIALGLEIDQMIKSPTYTIVREYQNGRLPLYHMDVYRVGGEGDDLALDEYFEGEGLSVVEWGELLEDYLPEEYLLIRLDKDALKEEQRLAVLTGVGMKGEAYLERIKNAEEANG
ncbi:tRNA (adenosine(37)-N6)-threonylcarbamoyltransferase complex ATPase subunit type 1 TsaE [Enterococcus sp. LJL128]|uniref:tRNA (adenosine(37)-N6)-threonylcarbamoyltransferase complex ATPase subunit type 1 TsaE n=1 Tax=Enterococcus sp. LJL51 TaxID=3416656 RepID=UPI003CF6F129